MTLSFTVGFEGKKYTLDAKGWVGDDFMRPPLSIIPKLDALIDDQDKF